MKRIIISFLMMVVYISSSFSQTINPASTQFTNGLLPPVRSTSPFIGKGSIWYDTIANQMKYYDGSSWITFSSISGSVVSSIFGRTGVVTAQSNDYNFAQIGSKPTTILGYGITDAYPLTGNPSSFLTVETDPNVPSYAKTLSAFSVIKSGTDPLYIFNNTSQQTANFNISGNGVIGGQLSLAGTLVAGINYYNNRNLFGAVSATGNYSSNFIQSDVTTSASGYRSVLGTAAAAFTVADVIHYRATQGTLGAGSAITRQYGLLVDDLTNGATNYGIGLSLSSSTNKYNIYSNGTAKNYLNGNTLIGTTTDNGEKLQVNGKITAATAPTNSTDVVRKMELDSKQNLITITTTGTSGAAIFNQSTGALNIPNYAPGGSGTVTSVAATSGYGLLTPVVTNSTTTPSILNAVDSAGVNGVVSKWRLAANLAGYMNLTTAQSAAGRKTFTGGIASNYIDNQLGYIYTAAVNLTNSGISAPAAGEVNIAAGSSQLLMKNTVGTLGFALPTNSSVNVATWRALDGTVAYTSDISSIYSTSHTWSATQTFNNPLIVKGIAYDSDRIVFADSNYLSYPTGVTGVIATTSNLPIPYSFSVTGTAQTVFTVTIGQTMANTTYKVSVTPTSMLAAAVFYVSNKTTTTFDVVYLTGITGLVSFEGAVFK